MPLVISSYNFPQLIPCISPSPTPSASSLSTYPNLFQKVISLWVVNTKEHIVSVNACAVCARLLQSCLTPCDPMDCSPPGSSVHGILQARILEWVAMPSSRGSSLIQGWNLYLLYLLHWQAGFFFFFFFFFNHQCYQGSP